MTTHNNPSRMTKKFKVVCPSGTALVRALVLFLDAFFSPVPFFFLPFFITYIHQSNSFIGSQEMMRIESSPDQEVDNLMLSLFMWCHPLSSPAKYLLIQA